MQMMKMQYWNFVVIFPHHRTIVVHENHYWKSCNSSIVWRIVIIMCLTKAAGSPIAGGGLFVKNIPSSHYITITMQTSKWPKEIDFLLLRIWFAFPHPDNIPIYVTTHILWLLYKFYCALFLLWHICLKRIRFLFLRVWRAVESNE